MRRHLAMSIVCILMVGLVHPIGIVAEDSIPKGCVLIITHAGRDRVERQLDQLAKLAGTQSVDDVRFGYDPTLQDLVAVDGSRPATMAVFLDTRRRPRTPADLFSFASSIPISDAASPPSKTITRSGRFIHFERTHVVVSSRPGKPPLPSPPVISELAGDYDWCITLQLTSLPPTGRQAMRNALMETRQQLADQPHVKSNKAARALLALLTSATESLIRDAARIQLGTKFDAGDGLTIVIRVNASPDSELQETIVGLSQYGKAFRHKSKQPDLAVSVNCPSTQSFRDFLLALEPNFTFDPEGPFVGISDVIDRAVVGGSVSSTIDAHLVSALDDDSPTIVIWRVPNGSDLRDRLRAAVATKAFMETDQADVLRARPSAATDHATLVLSNARYFGVAIGRNVPDVFPLPQAFKRDTQHPLVRVEGRGALLRKFNKALIEKRSAIPQVSLVGGIRPGRAAARSGWLQQLRLGPRRNAFADAEVAAESGRFHLSVDTRDDALVVQLHLDEQFVRSVLTDNTLDSIVRFVPMATGP